MLLTDNRIFIEAIALFLDKLEGNMQNGAAFMELHMFKVFYSHKHCLCAVWFLPSHLFFVQLSSHPREKQAFLKPERPGSLFVSVILK